MNNGTDNRFRMLLQMKRRILKYKLGNYNFLLHHSSLPITISYESTLSDSPTDE